MMSLPRLFVLVAVVEALYGLAGLLLPPSAIPSLLGWDLSPDGQWVTKLLGAALLTQAVTAWLLRTQPSRPMALVFAAYQLVAVLIDVLVLLFLDGALLHPVARFSALTAIPTHGTVGILLVLAAQKLPS